MGADAQSIRRAENKLECQASEISSFGSLSMRSDGGMRPFIPPTLSDHTNIAMPKHAYHGRLSVVVPVKNEQDNVEPLVREIAAALSSSAHLPVDVVFKPVLTTPDAIKAYSDVVEAAKKIHALLASRTVRCADADLHRLVADQCAAVAALLGARKHV